MTHGSKSSDGGVVNKSESIHELATALAKAQAAMRGASKDATNPHFNRKYADLASVWDACREALTANGLSVSQGLTSKDSSSLTVDTLLMHSGGQYLETSLTVPVSKADAQAFGSAATYARRYSLAAMVGVAPEDDDGEAASKAPRTPAKAAVSLADVRAGSQPTEPVKGNVAAAIASPAAEARLNEACGELDEAVDGAEISQWLDRRGKWFAGLSGKEAAQMRGVLAAACRRTDTPLDAVGNRIKEITKEIK